MAQSLTVKRKKYKSYIERIDKPTKDDRVEALMVAFQNVYYIVGSFFFGYFYSQTGSIIFILLVLIPILIKIGWDTKTKKPKIKLIR